jgi:Cd2+/Zn2+-exporting ATPase
LAAYLLAGWNVLKGALKTIRKGFFFDENILMVIATGGAMAIHAYAEAVGVMIFYKVGEMLQERLIEYAKTQENWVGPPFSLSPSRQI